MVEVLAFLYVFITLDLFGGEVDCMLVVVTGSSESSPDPGMKECWGWLRRERVDSLGCGVCWWSEVYLRMDRKKWIILV